MSGRARAAGILAIWLAAAIAGCATGNAVDHHRDGGGDFDASTRDGGGLDAGASDVGIDGRAHDAASTDDVASLDDAGSDAAVLPDTFVAPVDAFVPPADVGHDAPTAPCVGVDCSAMTTMCATGVCNAATGACMAMPRANGTACADANACTGPDTCMAGVCTSGPLIDCSSMTTACAVASCNPASGCVTTPVAAGTVCTDGNACTVGDACMGGTCVPGAATDCSSMSGACVIGTCSPTTGVCGTMPRPTGTACSDGNPCTTPDTCMAGTCRAGAMVSCAGMTTACATGVCNTATGACMASPLPNGTGCSDGNACTTGESCSSGSCVGGSATSCTGLDGPCTVGMCSAATGGCVATPRADGTACGGSGCGASVCVSGTCTATAAVDCGACGGGLYCVSGACGANPTTLSYGFESGTLPAGWTAGLGGTTPWTVINTGAHAGTYRVRSGAIGNNAQSRMGFTITLATPTMLTFALQTSSEQDFDFLQLVVDGAVQGSWSGGGGWRTGGTLLAAGTRTIEWRYVKDAGSFGGTDTVWIDDVLLTPATESTLTGFESASLPAGFTTSCLMYTGGSGSCAGVWTSRTDSLHTGARAAGSGTIFAWQRASLNYTLIVSQPSIISFWYRVSSETPDRLYFFVNGVSQNDWGGDVAWAHTSVYLAPGSNALEWRYEKDSSASALLDRAWIDDITVASATTGPPLCP